MAGNEDACKYIVLMFIAVLSLLFQDRTIENEKI